MGLQTSLTVEFDSGRVGQRVFHDFESRFGTASDEDKESGRLKATWNNAADNLIDAIVEEFNASDTILEVHLTKEE